MHRAPWCETHFLSNIYNSYIALRAPPVLYNLKLISWYRASAMMRSYLAARMRASFIEFPRILYTKQSHGCDNGNVRDDFKQLLRTHVTQPAIHPYLPLADDFTDDSETKINYCLCSIVGDDINLRIAVQRRSPLPFIHSIIGAHYLSTMTLKYSIARMRSSGSWTKFKYCLYQQSPQRRLNT